MDTMLAINKLRRKLPRNFVRGIHKANSNSIYVYTDAGMVRFADHDSYFADKRVIWIDTRLPDGYMKQKVRDVAKELKARKREGR